LQKIVLQQCDAKDGRTDGMIGDPRSCKIDFTENACEGANCLSREQAVGLNALYTGVKNKSGQTIYPGAEFGSEHYGDIWLFGSADKPAWGIRASIGYRRILERSLQQAHAKSALSVEAMQGLIARSSVPALADAKDTNLRPLVDSGNKLLIYHGLADPLIVPKPLENYFDAAAAATGGRDKLESAARLFMIPGWGHCWERPAPVADMFDPLQVLENWVEQGRAPEKLTLTSRDGTQTLVVPKY
jgi:feruloyl esterase